MNKIVNSAVTRRAFLGGSALAATLGLAACGGGVFSGVGEQLLEGAV